MRWGCSRATRCVNQCFVIEHFELSTLCLLFKEAELSQLVCCYLKPSELLLLFARCRWGRYCCGVCTLFKLAAKVDVSRIPFCIRYKKRMTLPHAPNTHSQHGPPHVGHKQSCWTIEHFNISIQIDCEECWCQWQHCYREGLISFTNMKLIYFCIDLNNIKEDVVPGPF